METWQISLGGLGMLILAGLAMAPGPTEGTFHVAGNPGPAKLPAAEDRSRDIQAYEPPKSNVDLRNEDFDRIYQKAAAGGKVSDRERRDFSDELLRRLEQGGPQH